MSAFASRRRFIANSHLGRLSLGLVLAVGIAAGSGPDTAEAKSAGAKAHGKRAVGAKVVSKPSASRKAAGTQVRVKTRAKARAAGRKIG
jgi:hypothetical protein